MSILALAFGSALAAAGVAFVVVAVRARSLDPAAVLASLEAPVTGPLDEFEERLDEPFLPRLLRPAGARVVSAVRGLMPGTYLTRLSHKLRVAGLEERIVPEEFVALQAGCLIAGGALATGIAAWLGWGSTGTTRAIAIGVIGGPLVPINWLQRSRERRQSAVRRDLPDVLDLMAISVEAGVGLEGAIEVVTEHFETPLAHEMGRMLREMELGLSRREALQNLKRRIEVPELSNFVLSLLQADALGMPLSRVLRVQSGELRMRRRQWARERAGRLPVKIVFPLMVFILPALFVVVIGPAVLSIGRDIL